MIDYFALLQLPRKPWIEVEEVKQKFLALSEVNHPDRFNERPPDAKAKAERQFKEINLAHTCLRDPKLRVLHFLELESGRKPQEIQEIPHETTQLFVEVGSMCRNVDQHLKNYGDIQSPLLRVKAFENNMDWASKVKTLLGKLAGWRSDLHQLIKDMNPFWDHLSQNLDGSGETQELRLVELERCYRLLSYESRWSSQLHERLFRLSTMA